MIKRFFKEHTVHKNIVPIFDTLFILRPTLFFSVWVMITIGMATATLSFNQHAIWLTNLHLSTLLIYIGVTCIASSTFILNQIQDKEGDEINNKLFLVGNYVSKDKASKIMNAIGLFGFILLVVSDWKIAIFGILLYSVWGVFYNYEYFYWKSKPVLGLVANMLAGIILFMIGWLHIFQWDFFTNKIINEMLVSSIPYVLSFTSVSLLTTLPDIEGDKQTGVRTFPIVFGNKTTVFLSTILVAVSIYTALINQDPIASTATIVSFPFFLFALLRGLEKDILRAIRYPIFILNFFVMVVYPWLFPAVFIVFYLSKYYYWHRFDLHYPTFIVEHDHDT